MRRFISWEYQEKGTFYCWDYSLWGCCKPVLPQSTIIWKGQLREVQPRDGEGDKMSRMVSVPLVLLCLQPTKSPDTPVTLANKVPPSSPLIWGSTKSTPKYPSSELLSEQVKVETAFQVNSMHLRSLCSTTLCCSLSTESPTAWWTCHLSHTVFPPGLVSLSTFSPPQSSCQPCSVSSWLSCVWFSTIS